MTTSLWSLLWWVVIGLLFFWMMSRGGCGVMGHSHRASDRANGHAGHAPSGRPVDPVCGIEVDPAKAAAVRTAGSETVYFCSQACLEAFDQNPTMYLHRNHERAGHRHHAGC